MNGGLGAFAIGAMCLGKAREELADQITNLPNIVRAAIKDPANRESKKIAEEQSEMAALNADVDALAEDLNDFLSFVISDTTDKEAMEAKKDKFIQNVTG